MTGTINQGAMLWQELLWWMMVRIERIWKNRTTWFAGSKAGADTWTDTDYNGDTSLGDASEFRESQGKQESRNQTAERLLDTYGNSVLRMAYSYLHNMEDAEDILQETLIQYMRTHPVLESSAHEKAWMLRVAANLSKNRIKYNDLRSTDELNEELQADEREDLSFVWEAVRSLPEKFREVVHLFYHEGYSTREIAEILDRKESTVRSDLRRGRESLKKILKEGYDFEG